MIYKIEEEQIKAHLVRTALFSATVSAICVAIIGILVFYIMSAGLSQSALITSIVFSILVFIIVFLAIYSSSSAIRTRRWEITESHIRQYVDISNMSDFMKHRMLSMQRRGKVKLETSFKRKYISKIRKTPYSLIVKGMGKDKIEIPKEVKNFNEIVNLFK